ncbi:MAG: hypothetical protein Q7U47_07225 [Paludibacter sp.]|nr:hypothetical protein [Paludibacter sp.]
MYKSYGLPPGFAVWFTKNPSSCFFLDLPAVGRFYNPVAYPAVKQISYFGLQILILQKAGLQIPPTIPQTFLNLINDISESSGLLPSR